MTETNSIVPKQGEPINFVLWLHSSSKSNSSSTPNFSASRDPIHSFPGLSYLRVSHREIVQFQRIIVHSEMKG